MTVALGAAVNGLSWYVFMVEAVSLFSFSPHSNVLFSILHASNSGLWRSVAERGSNPTGSVTGCAARHEARHIPRLRLAPACSQPRPRPGVAELGVVRRFLAPRVNERE